MVKDVYDRIRTVKVLLLDCDGVLTDGTAGYADGGGESKGFCFHDGAGMKYFQRAGGTIGIITGRKSPALAARAAELGIENVVQGALVKIDAYCALKEKMGFSDAEAAYLGDDLPDLPVLRTVGFSGTVANAVPYVKRRVDFVSQRPGGHGAVREFIELILKTQDKWSGIMRRYEK